MYLHIHTHLLPLFQGISVSAVSGIYMSRWWIQRVHDVVRHNLSIIIFVETSRIVLLESTTHYCLSSYCSEHSHLLQGCGTRLHNHKHDIHPGETNPGPALREGW